MAVYKLGDIGQFKGGISNLQKNRYDKGINFVNYMDILNNLSIDKNVVLRKYDANNKDILKYEVKYGDVFFTASSETINEIAFSSVYLSNENAIFNGFSKRFRFKHSILNPKYAGYFFRSLVFRNIVKKYATGYTRYNISQNSLNKIKINIPNLKVQKQIIDIIEPLEKLINKLKLIKNKIKILLINQYLQKENKYVNLSKIIFKKTQKRSKQNFYFQTNAVLELNIDFSKIINLNKANKVPSRANLVPQDNSILFSKLLGENKILPWFNELQNQCVFSTGFYNVQSKNLDHVLSFLLTKDFKEQKIIFANGTTMVGINDNSIKNIKIKKPNENSNVFSKFIFKLIFLENKINLIKNKVLNLLIK